MATGESPTRDWVVVAVVGVAAALVLAYSLLIAQQILLGVVVAVYAFVVYLLYRFVVAVERIAGAAERIADDRASVPPERD